MDRELQRLRSRRVRNERIIRRAAEADKENDNDDGVFG
jgi:hypothetical protein